MSCWRRDLVGAGAGSTSSVESRLNPAGVSSLNASKQRQYMSCSRSTNNPVERGGAESERRKQAQAEDTLHKVMYLNCWAQS
ncbi:hypothetical protein M0R45_013092 [Rubus argutus]|uniref:Uncharacterized protein n=1 Tax=Rubus argutus TaxID=59490 RepID=A0AAW1XKP2_RUBAR